MLYIYDIHFLALSYLLVNKMYKIMDNLNFPKGSTSFGQHLFPFGNTFISLQRFSLFDITDDDNDFALILKQKDYKLVLKIIIKSFLDTNLQIFICTQNDEYIQVLRDDIQPLYYYKNDNEMKYILFSNLDNFDFLTLKYFNVSYYNSQQEQFLNDANYNNTSSDTIISYINNNIQYKIPWIDIFIFIDDGTEKLQFLANDKIKLSKDIFYKSSIFDFSKRTKYIKILNRTISFQNAEKFISEYYNDPYKLDKYVIKSKHTSVSGAIKNQRKVLFEVNLKDPFIMGIVSMIYKTIYREIKKIYNSTDIDNYLL